MMCADEVIGNQLTSGDVQVCDMPTASENVRLSGKTGSARRAVRTTRLTRTGIRWGIPVKSIGPLASLSNKQCDGLSVAEVLKRDIR
jgi:hypothetical protein